MGKDETTIIKKNQTNIYGIVVMLVTGQNILTELQLLLLELLGLLSQNSTLLTALQSNSIPAPLPSIPAPLPPISTPPAPAEVEGRSFSHVGRGMGGALAQKQKVSKQITASAMKRKSVVDPDTGANVPSIPDVVEETDTRQAKRSKTAKSSGKTAKAR